MHVNGDDNDSSADKNDMYGGLDSMGNGFEQWRFI